MRQIRIPIQLTGNGGIATTTTTSEAIAQGVYALIGYGARQHPFEAVSDSPSPVYRQNTSAAFTSILGAIRRYFDKLERAGKARLVSLSTEDRGGQRWINVSFLDMSSGTEHETEVPA